VPWFHVGIDAVAFDLTDKEVDRKVPPPITCSDNHGLSFRPNDAPASANDMQPAKMAITLTLSGGG
jgi:hypothetical protein